MPSSSTERRAGQGLSQKAAGLDEEAPDLLGQRGVDGEPSKVIRVRVFLRMPRPSPPSIGARAFPKEAKVMTKRLSPRIFSITALLGAAAALGACGGAGKTAARDPSASAQARGPACAFEGPAGPAASAHGVQPIGAAGTGSTVALASVNGRRIAFIADEDAKAVLAYDVDAKKQLASTDLGGVPSQVYLTRDGRLLVTVRDASKLVAFRVDRADARLEKVCETATPAEPVAIASSPDEKTVLVTSGWGQRLASFDAGTLAQGFEAKLSREPRGVVVSDDGKSAFVSHAVGSVVSVVDLAGPKHAVRTIAMRGKDANALAQLTQTRRLLEAQAKGAPNKLSPQLANLDSLERRAAEGRPSCQGFVLAKSAAVQNRIFAPQVMVDPGDLEKRATGYGDSGSVPEVPAVAVIDEAAAAPLEGSMSTSRAFAHFGARDPRAVGECLLPRAAAIDPKTKSLLVTCLGIDAVVAYDAMSGSPGQATRRHWNVGAGPSGIAIDAEKRQAVVFSQFDRTVSVLTLGDDELIDDRSAPAGVEKTALAPPTNGGLSPEMLIGRMLFHASGDPRISFDGRACASCHPDGRDDAITWATPEGPRRSIMLAGRLTKTSPYSWDGNAATIDAHLGATFQRLRGHGIRSFELEALVSYVSSLPAPPPRVIEDKAKVERGRQIFVSTQAGCSSCHAGADLTDGMNHDVGSKHAADLGAKFNTPSLHFIGGTGPYFHDGRYATLGDLLRKSDGKMGRTKHLTNADLDALQSYLETL